MTGETLLLRAELRHEADVVLVRQYARLARRGRDRDRVDLDIEDAPFGRYYFEL